MLRWTLGYMCLFQFWFPQGICPAVGLLEHMAVPLPVFKGISTLFSTVVLPVYIPTTVKEDPLFSTPSPVFNVCRLFDDGHSDQCEMIPHCVNQTLNGANNPISTGWPQQCTLWAVCVCVMTLTISGLSSLALACSLALLPASQHVLWDVALLSCMELLIQI